MLVMLGLGLAFWQTISLTKLYKLLWAIFNKALFLGFVLKSPVVQKSCQVGLASIYTTTLPTSYCLSSISNQISSTTVPQVMSDHSGLPSVKILLSLFSQNPPYSDVSS